MVIAKMALSDDVAASLNIKLYLWQLLLHSKRVFIPIDVNEQTTAVSEQYSLQ